MAAEVDRLLRAMGLNPFIAHRDIPASKQWREEIRANLDYCRIFVAVLTEGFRTSEWCNQEVGIALSRSGVIVIPISVAIRSYGFLSDFQEFRWDSREGPRVARGNAKKLAQVLADGGIVTASTMVRGLGSGPGHMETDVVVETLTAKAASEPLGRSDALLLVRSIQVNRRLSARRICATSVAHLLQPHVDDIEWSDLRALADRGIVLKGSYATKSGSPGVVSAGGPDPYCSDVRSYLQVLAQNGRPKALHGVWEGLVIHGAVTGTPTEPQITPVGSHVLSELSVSAYRTDRLPLSLVAEMLSRTITTFDEVAKIAEYYMAELGPVIPPTALPFVRPLAIGLALRGESPEETAEDFRNVWGAVEVMGGHARDRLLAAEILHSSSAGLERVFAPILTTCEAIRTRLGPEVNAATAGTLIQVAGRASRVGAMDRFFELASKIGDLEASALFAVLSTDPQTAVSSRNQILDQWGIPKSSEDGLHAATYLAAIGADIGAISRARRIAMAIGDEIPTKLVSAALLSSLGNVEPVEVAEWLRKAIGTLESRQLAPSPSELGALAVGLIHGLSENELLSPQPHGPRPATVPLSIPALVALHEWIYRPLTMTSAFGLTPTTSPNAGDLRGPALPPG